MGPLTVLLGPDIHADIVVDRKYEVVVKLGQTYTAIRLNLSSTIYFLYEFFLTVKRHSRFLPDTYR